MKPTLATLGLLGTLTFGAVDATVLRENPVEYVTVVKGERVEAKQVGNVVEATLPWRGEKGITIKADMGEPTLAERVADKRKKEVVTQLINDEFKIDFILNEKPDTNVFCQTIEGAEDYDWFYQPPLTEEEIAEGASRPENVVGSYAVYHKTLKDHRLGGVNYETGKAFHVYRPEVWELNSTTTRAWAELSFEDNRLCVTAPQEFLDKAEYPVRVDPTFGYTGLGGSEIQVVRGRLSSAFALAQRVGNAYTAPEAGTLYSITAFLRAQEASANYNVDFKFYLNETDSDGADSHGEISKTESLGIAISDTVTAITLVASNEPIAASADYLINILGNPADLQIDGSVKNVAMPVDVGAGSVDYKTSNGDTDATGYSDLDTDPWNQALTAATNRYTLYATYCPVAGDCLITETFTATDTWTVPDGVTSADVACWGGGGGGVVVSLSGGAGGGGGAFASSTVAVTPLDDYTVTIGTGGAGGITGGGGADSTFVADDKTVNADGGTGATSATSNGVGGTTANSTGDVEFAGGNGSDGSTTGDIGGGGGGAGGPSGAGVTPSNASGGVGATGGAGNNGNGGAGGTGDSNGSTSPGGGGGGSHPLGGGGGGGGDDGDPGGDGGFPGGGGGGAEVAGTGSEGGDGAVGQCTITYTIPASGGGDTPAPVQDVFWF